MPTLLVILSFAMTLMVSSAYASLEQLQEQQQIVIETYKAILPKPVMDKKYSDIRELHFGQTEDEKVCAVHASGAVITMMVHPSLKSENHTYSDIQFDWEPLDLNSNVLGIPVTPSFESTSSSLTASVTFASGHGLNLNRMGLKIKIKKNKALVSIRNRTKLLSSYLDCVFTK
ncbi:MAG: hypothetical protein SGJ18_15290 [Pseudomonadota bacterium]|nr:hypothetical protein [Pseudomonadota bacterium]